MVRNAYRFALALGLVAFSASTAALAAGTDTKLVKKVQKYVESVDDYTSLPGKEVKKADLKGAALKDFEKQAKEWSDYPPSATEFKVDGTDLVAIVTATDGGNYIEIYYYPSGKYLTSGSQGESEDLSWDN